MDEITENQLLDEIDELADAYGQNPSIEPEAFALGFVASVRSLSWDDVRHLRRGIGRRIDERNTEHALGTMIESAILNPDNRKN